MGWDGEGAGRGWVGGWMGAGVWRSGAGGLGNPGQDQPVPRGCWVFSSADE